MRALGVMLVAGLSACGGLDDGFGVATTVVFDSSVSDALLARMTKLDVSVSGDETFSGDVALTMPLRTETFIYRPEEASRHLILTLDATDADGVALASGQSGVVTLTSGNTAQTSIVMHATMLTDGGVLPDLSVPRDFTGEDLTGVDLATGVHVDMAPDLVRYDASGGGSHCSALKNDPTVLACQGYEDASDLTYVSTLAGTATIDTTRHFRGASSVHVATQQTADDAYVFIGQGAYTIPAELHLRTFVYATETLSNATLIDISGPYEAVVDQVALGTAGAYDVQTCCGSGAVEKTSTAKLPLNVWTCMEWVINQSTTSSGSMSLYVNETQLSELDYSGATNSVGYGSSETTLGLYFVNATASADIWFDETIVSGSYIGCEK